ncbi:unnamed protein product [Caenorhabditis brenneri]
MAAGAEIGFLDFVIPLLRSYGGSPGRASKVNYVDNMTADYGLLRPPMAPGRVDRCPHWARDRNIPKKGARPLSFKKDSKLTDRWPPRPPPLLLPGLS